MTVTQRSTTALVLAALLAGCSGMGTTMSKVGRMGKNRGYEIAAELPIVQQAALDVLKARGYDVSLKPDPDNGAEGAGQIAIGQRIVKYSPPVGAAPTAPEVPKQMDTRDLVDIYLSKKWQMGSDQGALNITLVDIVGGNYLRLAPGGTEEEVPLTSDYIAALRNEIERKVDESRDPKPVAK
jgi:hypothetical protein